MTLRPEQLLIERLTAIDMQPPTPISFAVRHKGRVSISAVPVTTNDLHTEPHINLEQQAFIDQFLPELQNARRVLGLPLRARTLATRIGGTIGETVVEPSGTSFLSLKLPINYRWTEGCEILSAPAGGVLDENNQVLWQYTEFFGPAEELVSRLWVNVGMSPEEPETAHLHFFHQHWQPDEAGKVQGYRQFVRGKRDDINLHAHPDDIADIVNRGFAEMYAHILLAKQAFAATTA